MSPRLFVLVAIAAARIAVAQLPPVPVPVENPITPAKAMLGKILFWDEQLSSDNTTACGSCHMAEVGGGDPRAATPQNVSPGPDGVFNTADDIRGSRGVVRCDPLGHFTPEPFFFPNAQVTRRKSPSFIGAQWSPELFWDGRAGGTFHDPVTQQVVIQNDGALESQAAGPSVSDVEMACQNRSPAALAAKVTTLVPLHLATNVPAPMAAAIAANPTYPQLFQAAFGDPAVTAARIAMAIATYERTLIPDQTPWDLFTGGNPSALTPAQTNGLLLFNGIANCALCHIPPLFTDHSFANIGVRPDIEDLGRNEVTNLITDKGKFRVPSLRNVGLRAPFFHNGGKATLQDVLTFYKVGGDFPGPNLDVRLLPLIMTHTQEAELLDFVTNALIDPRVANALPPFDRPTLNSELTFNFPATYGTGSSGTGGFVPTWAAPHPPYVGNDHFVIGLTNAVGGATAYFAFTPNPAQPGATILGKPLWIDSPPETLVPLTLSGSPGVAGAGHTSFLVNIPNQASYSDLTGFGQWFVLDAGATNGLAVSSGLILTTYTAN